MGVTLRIQSPWRQTPDSPCTWQLDGDDERLLRDAVRHLSDERRADPDLRNAVAVIHEDDGTLVGAWDRIGTADLSAIVLHESPDDVARRLWWGQISSALLDAAGYLA